jgi:hypothetical protein
LISKESKDLMISHTFQWLGVQVIPSVSTIFSCRSRSACCPCCPCWSVIPGYWHCDWPILDRPGMITAVVCLAVSHGIRSRQTLQ